MIKCNLKRLLDKKDMSQRELSRRAGVRPDTIGTYYNSTFKRINVSDLEKICLALDCKIGDLLEILPGHPGNFDISSN